MTELIAQCVDNGITILAAALLLRYYFKPEAKKLYKKKWVLAGCIIMVFYSVVELGVAYRKHIDSQALSRESIVNIIQGSGKLVTKDFIFSSEDGYQILIPSGYTYAAPQAEALKKSGAMSAM